MYSEEEVGEEEMGQWENKESQLEYKEMTGKAKGEVKKDNQRAYDELYERLDTKEGEKELYWLASQRDRAGKDMQQVVVIKDRMEMYQQERRECWEDGGYEDEIRKAVKRMKNRMAVVFDNIA